MVGGGDVGVRLLRDLVTVSSATSACLRAPPSREANFRMSFRDSAPRWRPPRREERLPPSVHSA
jgi:hypothetical protein